MVVDEPVILVGDGATSVGSPFARVMPVARRLPSPAVVGQLGLERLARGETTPLADRRKLGSVRGLFPVLRVGDTPIHESLAICEYVADAFPDARLWPAEPLQRAGARAICTEMVSGFCTSRCWSRASAYWPT